MSVAAVVIGRNEGDRLKRCLNSLVGQVDELVYVDSGSTDGSVGFARTVGAQIVELDTTVPFTAARARNAGFEAIEGATFVQFVDGDCSVVDGWIAKATEAMQDGTIGIVTGWRSEIDPEATVYNAMAQVEWHRPAGDIIACGGDMMVRVSAFREVGGFNPNVIAAEDDEFCLRLGKSGHRVVRLPEEMTRHDINMTRFREWWKRTIRNGHGFAQVGRMHEPHLLKERQRVWFYGLALPLTALIGLVGGLWPVTLLVVAVYVANWWRTARGLRQSEGLSPGMARHQAIYLTLAKIPNLIGMMTYHIRRWRGSDATIIEYK